MRVDVAHANAVERAIETAVSYHAGQIDKSGQPYILHPLRVGAAGQTEQEQIVGFLHDVLEDTTCTVVFLIRSYGCTVTNAVVALSRGWVDVKEGHIYFKNNRPGLVRETYPNFIKRCRLNNLAALVKFRDIHDNLSRLANLSAKEQKYLRAKYTNALELLGVEE